MFQVNLSMAEKNVTLGNLEFGASGWITRNFLREVLALANDKKSIGISVSGSDCTITCPATELKIQDFIRKCVSKKKKNVTLVGFYNYESFFSMVDEDNSLLDGEYGLILTRSFHLERFRSYPHSRYYMVTNSKEHEKLTLPLPNGSRWIVLSNDYFVSSRFHAVEADLAVFPIESEEFRNVYTTSEGKTNLASIAIKKMYQDPAVGNQEFYLPKHPEKIFTIIGENTIESLEPLRKVILENSLKPFVHDDLIKEIKFYPTSTLCEPQETCIQIDEKFFISNSQSLHYCLDVLPPFAALARLDPSAVTDHFRTILWNLHRVALETSVGMIMDHVFLAELDRIEDVRSLLEEIKSVQPNICIPSFPAPTQLVPIQSQGFVSFLDHIMGIARVSLGEMKSLPGKMRFLENQLKGRAFDEPCSICLEDNRKANIMFGCGHCLCFLCLLECPPQCPFCKASCVLPLHPVYVKEDTKTGAKEGKAAFENAVMEFATQKGTRVIVAPTVAVGEILYGWLEERGIASTKVFSSGKKKMKGLQNAGDDDGVFLMSSCKWEWAKYVQSPSRNFLFVEPPALVIREIPYYLHPTATVKILKMSS